MTLPGALLGVLAAAWLLVLSSALWQLPLGDFGLQAPALEQLPHSGVEHGVTAVLLNYRAYDTFLELVVLLAAVLGARASGWQGRLPLSAARGPLLPGMARLLLPLLLLTAAYLLWLGKYDSGGSFQAGALLGAAGVLALLAAPAGSRPNVAGLVRFGLVAGAGCFLLVGVLVMPLTGMLLAYPINAAGELILLIEIVITFSIGLALMLLFAGDGEWVDPS